MLSKRARYLDRGFSMVSWLQDASRSQTARQALGPLNGVVIAKPALAKDNCRVGDAMGEINQKLRLRPVQSADED